MRLTDLFRPNSQMTENLKSTQSAGNIGQSVNPGRALLSNLTPGQTIMGEVVSKNGSEVQLKLGDDTLINAKLDQNMNLDVGKLLSFEVKGNGQNLLLSPLFTNMASEATLMKALDMAELPVNQETVTMTGKMMEAGLPVDKDSLRQIYREIKDATMEDTVNIVDLHRLGLEVNENSIKQMDAYKNFAHQLGEGMQEVISGLAETIESMNADGYQVGNAEFMADVFGELAKETVGNAEQSAEMTGASNLTEALPMSEGEEAANALQGKEQLTEKLLSYIQDGKEWDENGFSEELGNALKGTELSEGEKTTLVNNLLQKGVALQKHDLLASLTGNKAVQELLTDRLNSLASITPEEMEDAKAVENLYQRLDRQLKGLGRALETAGKEDTTAFRAVNQLNQNLDFLHQVNQVYNYVQLPIRMQQGNAHGDLYVYTNKKNLSAKDGQVSALLYLDMEHLGPVDVYVALQAEKVNTRFYVQDDDMLDFLNDHMDLLTERLKKRGYDLTVNMQTKEEAMAAKNQDLGALAPLLPEENRGTMIQQHAFDMRA